MATVRLLQRRGGVNKPKGYSCQSLFREGDIRDVEQLFQIDLITRHFELPEDFLHKVTFLITEPEEDMEIDFPLEDTFQFEDAVLRQCKAAEMARTIYSWYFTFPDYGPLNIDFELAKFLWPFFSSSEDNMNTMRFYKPEYCFTTRVQKLRGDLYTLDDLEIALIRQDVEWILKEHPHYCLSWVFRVGGIEHIMKLKAWLLDQKKPFPK